MAPRYGTLARTLLAFALALIGSAPRTALVSAGRAAAERAPANEATYLTRQMSWRAADGGLSGWRLRGLQLAEDGSLVLDPARAKPGVDPYLAGGYHGRSFYNGGRFVVGQAVSPVTRPGIGFFEAIPSWDARTPPGSWIEIELRARVARRWTRWYNLGVWATGADTIARHSVDGQADADGDVDVDTLSLSMARPAADAVQLRVRLFAAAPDAAPEARPSLRGIAVALSNRAAVPAEPAPGNPALWDRRIPVPACSQMVYPDGGEVWCSPTSTAMVLAHWGYGPAPCEAGVRAAVDGVFDWVYDGHGNWPFNTAYAANLGLAAQVARFTSLTDAEPWIAAGVPVIFTFSWRPGEIDGVALPSSNGHLAVLVGFDAAGNPIVNDPAAPNDAGVPRVYDRGQIERAWLAKSGGTVYLLYPPGHTVPALP